MSSGKRQWDKGPFALLLLPAAHLLPAFILHAHMPPAAAHLFPLPSIEPSSLLKHHFTSDTAGSQMVSLEVALQGSALQQGG